MNQPPPMSSLALAATDGAPHPRPRPLLLEPPGGFLVWLIVVVEVITFGAGLAVFAAQEAGNVAVFREGRAHLSQGIALANTIALLTGGWCMATGIHALRHGQHGRARSWILAAIATGALFLGLKAWEYAGKLQQGLDLHASPFHTLYWLLTGFHFLHVAAAMVILAVLTRGIRRGTYTADSHADVEAGGVFWHMCDLIWLLLYPVIYLLT